MFEKLKVKSLYDDFIEKVQLSEEQIKLLDLLINKESVVKIAIELGMSQRTVSYEIKKLKKLYNDYKQLELIRILTLFN